MHGIITSDSMGALNYIAAVIFAALFIGIGFTLYSQYQRGAAERNFLYRAELLAERIEALRPQSPGAVDYFEISVPSNCELRFGENAVVAVVGSRTENFYTNISISDHPILSNQEVNLKLERTESGVSVSEA